MPRIVYIVDAQEATMVQNADGSVTWDAPVLSLVLRDSEPMPNSIEEVEAMLAADVEGDEDLTEIVSKEREEKGTRRVAAILRELSSHPKGSDWKEDRVVVEREDGMVEPLDPQEIIGGKS